MQEIFDIITKLITNVGFPIACCIIMFFQNEKMRQSLDNNTQALLEIKTKLKDD